MCNLLNKFLSIGVFCAAVFISFAQAESQDPYKVVQQTTEQVLAIIKDAKVKGATEKDPKHFNAKVTAVMDKVIDFDNFARGIMGTYASAQRYKALKSEAEKAAFQDRIKRFSLTFKQGLVDTYAANLLNFSGEKIETLPPRKGDDLSSGSATVMQNVANSSGKAYVVQYTMRRNKNGEWKLQNLIIEGINLGLTYRNQFAEAADKYHGDLDKVIANWKVEPEISESNESSDAKKEIKK
jgi:phospholipid transport system substrate-binding protein